MICLNGVLLSFSAADSILPAVGYRRRERVTLQISFTYPSCVWYRSSTDKRGSPLERRSSLCLRKGKLLAGCITAIIRSRASAQGSASVGRQGHGDFWKPDSRIPIRSARPGSACSVNATIGRNLAASHYAERDQRVVLSAADEARVQIFPLAAKRDVARQSKVRAADLPDKITHRSRIKCV